ncbi:hypothetical protein Tco_1245052 [Tanacetum coccineum]
MAISPSWLLLASRSARAAIKALIQLRLGVEPHQWSLEVMWSEHQLWYLSLPVSKMCLYGCTPSTQDLVHAMRAYLDISIYSKAVRRCVSLSLYSVLIRAPKVDPGWSCGQPLDSPTCIWERSSKTSFLRGGYQPGEYQSSEELGGVVMVCDATASSIRIKSGCPIDNGAHVRQLAQHFVPPGCPTSGGPRSDTLPCPTETCLGKGDPDLRWSRCRCRLISLECLCIPSRGNRVNHRYSRRVGRS